MFVVHLLTSVTFVVQPILFRYLGNALYQNVPVIQAYSKNANK